MLRDMRAWWVVRGYGVVAAGVPGVAAREPPQGQPRAAQGAVQLDRLERVLRAGGMEAAPWTEQRTDEQLIAADQDAEDEAHRSDIFRQSFSRERRSCALSAPPGVARRPITMSSAGSAC